MHEIDKDEIVNYHNQLSGAPYALSSPQGELIWESETYLWGSYRRPANNQVTLLNGRPLRFQGQYFDQETGLHYNTFRYYDPETGRFTQQDPIGLAGGINLYQYAPNPLSWVEPLGWAKNCGGVSAKKVKQLQEGKAGTVVYVGSKKEADALLKAAFPNYQKVKGIGHQKITGGDVKARINNKMDRFENKGQAYHKDYAIGKDGRLILHKQGPKWHEYPHIDINRGANGVKDIVHIAIKK